MTKVSWQSIVKPYLSYWNDYFNDGSENKYHLLFVEGGCDNESCYKLFNAIYSQNPLNDLRIKRRDILFDFSNKFRAINEFGRGEYNEDGDIIENEYTNGKEKRLHRKMKNIKKKYKNIDGYNAFNFVTECINVYNNTPFDHIHCFGMIDNDFGQHKADVLNLNSGGSNVIAQTYYHDRETTMLRISIPNYIKSCIEDPHFDEIKEKIKNDILFSVKQGILDKASLNYKNSYATRTADLCREYAHGYFKNDNPIIVHNLDFFTHYIRGSIFDNNFISILERCLIDEFPTIFSASSSVLDENRFNSLLLPYIDRWLNGIMESHDKVVIDKAFELINAHVLFSALADNNTVIKKGNNVIRKEKTLLDVLFNMKNADNINSIIKLSPFKEYLKYRRDLDKDKIITEFDISR